MPCLSAAANVVSTWINHVPCHCQNTYNKPQVSMITFEDMIDRLEKNSGQTVVSLKEAKMLLKVRKDKNTM